MEYLYFTSDKDIRKFALLENKYIPFHNKYNIELEPIKDAKIIICHYKSSSSHKKIYCWTTIQNILYYEEKENVIFNNTIYEKMLTKYNLTKLPELYFLELRKIHFFGYDIIVKDLNEKLKEQDKDHNDFKFPKGKNNYFLTESYYNNLHNKIEEFVNLLDESEEEESEESSSDFYDDKSNEESKEEINNLDTSYQIMEIPVYLSGCKELLKHIKNLTIKTKIFREHYMFCKKCDKNNNNQIEINWLHKKILLKTYPKNKFMKGILKSYFKAKNYIVKNMDKFIEEDCDINKINIIQLKDKNNIYDNDFFIIYKN